MVVVSACTISNVVERIVIKADSKEIVIRGKPEEGHVDVFSYNYEGSSANGLGSLFIVGHVQPADEDTSYMINLVASLAKREYYAQADAVPKEAFSKTLKKINEVLQDFFKKKELKVNIGIFTVAGENIFISRLGKFKIILARDNQTIDILNNINLFSKEHIQEEEFSNIISGKVMTNDKILAFYPGRSITAREKKVKDDFIKMGADELSEKLNSIKNENDSFLCAAVHITINKYKEPAIINTPQPKELKESFVSAQPVVAKISKTPVQKLKSPELPSVRPPAETKVSPDIISKPKTESLTPELKAEKTTGSNVYYPGNISSLPSEISTPIDKTDPANVSPLIRQTEFSSAKKGSVLDVILRKFKPSGVYIIGVGQGKAFSKKQLIISSSAVALIVFAVIAKFTFAPSLPIPGFESPENKAISALEDQIKPKIESAKTYRDQNNLLEARRLLIESLSALASASIPESERVEEIRQEVIATLDGIDKAVSSLPSLFQEAPQNLADDFQIWSYVWSLAKGEIKAEKPELSAISFYPYQDNLYILATDGIYKITDGLKSAGTPVPWLNKDVFLPINPVSFAIDSKVFVIAESGVLTAYYKGDKVSEVNTSIPVSKGSAMLTKTDSAYLYLVDKSLVRIYVLTKEAGSLFKTLKLDSEEPIVSASMADDETIYILSSDNKVWKVTP